MKHLKVYRKDNVNKDEKSELIDASEGFIESAQTAINSEAETLQDAIANIKRRKAYPEIGDQLDVIWKQLSKFKEDGQDLIPEADDLLDSISNTKTKYTKPNK